VSRPTKHSIFAIIPPDDSFKSERTTLRELLHQQTFHRLDEASRREPVEVDAAGQA